MEITIGIGMGTMAAVSHEAGQTVAEGTPAHRSGTVGRRETEGIGVAAVNAAGRTVGSGVVIVRTMPHPRRNGRLHVGEDSRLLPEIQMAAARVPDAPATLGPDRAAPARRLRSGNESRQSPAVAAAYTSRHSG